VAERGQQLMLDRMAPSKAMISVFQQKHPDKPLPKNVREWIRLMEIEKDMIESRKKVIIAEDQYLTLKQQKQYQEVYKKIEERIKDIIKNTTADEQQKNLKRRQFPSHPILARWGEIWREIEKIIDNIDNKFEEPVKDKIRAVFEAKRQLAEKQKYYTDLFLETTIQYMPGGYYGWNKRLKGVLSDLLEASPYFASLFKEPNCVGRMILLSGMLMEAQVFEEKDLVTMATYKHAFLGSFDALGVGRVIEGSGPPKHSYFGIPKEKFFQGKVFNNQEIILQLPLQVGLIAAGDNYLSYLEMKKIRELELYLLKQNGYIVDLLWNSLSSALDNLLDCLFSRSRAASINNFYPDPFYFLLYSNEKFTKDFEALKQEKSSPLLPYIKLNLLVMKKALNDEKNAEELIIRINMNKLKGKSEFTKDDVETMKENLQTLLSNLADIETPSYWQKKYGPNLENENATIEQMREDLWNPNLFPKPVAIDDEGNVIWEIPSPKQTIPANVFSLKNPS
jgi:hypothetical protein